MYSLSVNTFSSPDLMVGMGKYPSGIEGEADCRKGK
jgi:hypothetical protein